jgi:hypothetical protein
VANKIYASSLLQQFYLSEMFPKKFEAAELKKIILASSFECRHPLKLP